MNNTIERKRYNYELAVYSNSYLYIQRPNIFLAEMFTFWAVFSNSLCLLVEAIGLFDYICKI